MYASEFRKLDARLEFCVLRSSRLEFCLLRLVAILLDEELAERPDIEGGRDEYEREQRQAAEVHSRPIGVPTPRPPPNRTTDTTLKRRGLRQAGLL